MQSDSKWNLERSRFECECSGTDPLDMDGFFDDSRSKHHNEQIFTEAETMFEVP